MADITRESIIHDIQDRLETLTPREISDYTINLSIFLGNMSEGMAHASKAYYRKWESTRRYCESDGMATNLAKATSEYEEKKKIEIEFEATRELIHALKKRQNVLSDEGEGKY